MKIKDIIIEQGGYQAGKSFVSKAVSPSQWGLGNDPSYQSGKSFVNKIFNPSQWFQGGQNFQAGQSAVNKAFTPTRRFQGSSSKSTSDRDDDSLPNDHINLGSRQPFEVRRNLDNLSSGRYYNQDIAVAKMFHDQLKSGTFKPAIDIEATISSLKRIIDGYSVSKDDLERVKKLKTATKNLS